MFSLYELKKDHTGKIHSCINDEHTKMRLAEMGFLIGVEVRMVRKSPFGGPIHIKLNNYYLTLRKEDALLIFINSIEK